jgi:hypothetical protein
VDNSSTRSRASQPHASNGAIRAPIETVLDALREHQCDPREKGNSWEAKCPAHDSDGRKLYVSVTSDGTVLVNCRSHRCGFVQIAAALGIDQRDFFPRHLGSNGTAQAPRRPATFKNDEAFLDFIKPWTFVFPSGPHVNRIAQLGFNTDPYGAVDAKPARWKGRNVVVVEVPSNPYADATAAICLERGAAEVMVWRVTEDCLTDQVEWTKLVRFEEPWREGESVRKFTPAPPRPSILVTTREFEVIDQAVAALRAETNVFQRAGGLVTILTDLKPVPKRYDITRPPGSLRIVPLPNAQLRRLMTIHADWTHETRDRKGNLIAVDAHPPSWAVEGVATMGTWEGIPVLEGIIEAPTLRPDGSLLDKAGYDPDTGLFLKPNGAFDPIPDKPTKDQAIAAVGILFNLVQDFPFAGPDHQATWLASLLTPLARHAIDGPCPLFLFDANNSGTGKTKLCDVVAIVASGREMPRGSYPPDDSEMGKLLLSVALAADRFVMFDNVPTGFSVGGSALDRALTSRTIKDRILGQSAMTPELPFDTVLYATGSNLSLRGDALRRVVPCRLETEIERPEERTGFAIEGDFLDHVKKHRGRLVAAALTILRAYVVAGRPDQSLTPMDYTAWCGLVRNAIHWAIGIDPCQTRRQLVANDEEANKRKALVEGWESLCGDRKLTIAQALSEIDMPGNGTLREVFIGWSKDGKLPSAMTVGKQLSKLRGRPVGGKCLDKTSSAVAEWFVKKFQ